MVTFCEEVVATTIGTGVVETRLNTDTPVTVSEKARGLLEVVPFQVSNGAYTAAQGYLTQMRLQSDDEAFEPKRFILDPIQGGLGATFTTFAPMLLARPINKRLDGGERINVYATAQVANTVAPLVGAGLVCDNTGVGGSEVFYQKPDNETATGTTVNTRTTGGTIQISGARAITDFWFALTNGTNTVSESVAGTISFESSDWDTNVPQRWPIQPYGGFLGATGANHTTAITKIHLPRPIPCPKDKTITITPFFANRILFTAAGNFITGISYLK